MITCTNLRKAFNGQEVLKGLSLTIGSQEITVVIGRSGEGKSVFLKTPGGADKAGFRVHRD